MNLSKATQRERKQRKNGGFKVTDSEQLNKKKSQKKKDRMKKNWYNLEE